MYGRRQGISQLGDSQTDFVAQRVVPKCNARGRNAVCTKPRQYFIAAEDWDTKEDWLRRSRIDESYWMPPHSV